MYKNDTSIPKKSVTDIWTYGQTAKLSFFQHAWKPGGRREKYIFRKIQKGIQWPEACTERERRKKTRPDTRTSVAYGWAGAVMLKNRYRKKRVTDRPTDGWTDRPRDTPSYRVAVRN